MSKKKPQDKLKFEVKKRIPKEKPDFFQNLTPFAHPVAEILNFHKDEPEPVFSTELQTQAASKTETTGQISIDPLDHLDHLDRLLIADFNDGKRPLDTKTEDPLDPLEGLGGLNDEKLKSSNYPVSPAKDFAKLPNSIRRAVQQGDFPGHSLQIYLYLYSLTRGAIQPKRVTRATKPKIKIGAGVGSDVTLNKHLNHLRIKGYLKITEIRGQYLGNEYEVFIPEEITEVTSVSDLLDHLHPLDHLDGLKTDGLDPLETRPSSPSQIVENKGVYPETKTFFKEEEKLRTDDEGAFVEFYEKFQTASVNLTGKKLSKNDADNLSKLADLLILELNIAARRTGSISSVPAFLTEVLRRRLREALAANNKPSKVKIDTVGKPEPGSYQIKPLDEKGRAEALEQLVEFAEDDLLQDFRKWYTEEDWAWLTEELNKGKAVENETKSSK